MSMRVCVAVAVVLGYCGAASAQGPGRPGGMGMGQMRGGQQGGMCAGRGQTQSLQTGGQSGMQSAQAMRGMPTAMYANRMPMNNQLSTGYRSNQMTAAQAAAAEQWRQYVRATGMHPTNQRWLIQGSYR